MSLVRPYKATIFDSIGLVQFGEDSAITPSSTWTKLPGFTHITRVSGDEFTSTAAWRITDTLGGWAFYSAVTSIEVNEAQTVDYGFGISGSDPVSVFTARAHPLVASAAAPALVIIEAWLELTAGQYVEPFAQIVGSATATLLPTVGTFSASRGQNEP